MSSDCSPKPIIKFAVIRRKYASLKKIGITRYMRSYIISIPYLFLRQIYGFEKWHSTNSYAVRPYKKHVVALANSLDPRSVVEIGCGLGEILTRVKAASRIGIDADKKVIRAARFLHPGPRYICADIRDTSTLIGETDCLIATGWLHMLEPQQLAEILVPLTKTVRYFILDSFCGELPSNSFRHDFRFFSGHAECISYTAPIDDTIREYFVFRSVRYESGQLLSKS